jgi:hypothetical protein
LSRPIFARHLAGFLVQIQHHAVADDAGRGDDDVDLAEGIDGGLDELGRFRLARDVGLDADHLAAHVLDVLDHAVDVLLHHVDDDDLGAIAHEVFGDGFADAVAGTGDDGNASLDVHD